MNRFSESEEGKKITKLFKCNIHKDFEYGDLTTCPFCLKWESILFSIDETASYFRAEIEKIIEGKIKMRCIAGRSPNIVTGLHIDYPELKKEISKLFGEEE